MEWVFTGGTPVPEQETAAATGSQIRPMPNAVGRNSLVIGPLLLIGFLMVLWYAFNRTGDTDPVSSGSIMRRMLKRRKELFEHLADLDYRYERHSLGRREYLRQREAGMRLLRRIALLLKKN